LTDAVVDSYVAIIMLENGALSDWFYLRFPVHLPQISPAPGLDAQNAENVSFETTAKTTHLSGANGLSTTSLSETTDLLDQTLDAPVLNTTIERNSASFNTMLVSVIGPMMYTYFSINSTSDAGFTVDLIFQHPSYLKVSPSYVIVFSDKLYTGLLLITLIILLNFLNGLSPISIRGDDLPWTSCTVT